MGLPVRPERGLWLRPRLGRSSSALSVKELPTADAEVLGITEVNKRHCSEKHTGCLYQNERGRGISNTADELNCAFCKSVPSEIEQAENFSN